MKIAIVSIANPVTGTGVGTIEYTYQLVLRLREIKGNKVDVCYAVPDAKRNDALGMIYTFTLFKKKLEALAKEDYDIIHITIQDLGFAAKILRKNGTRAKIITTVHDLIRLKKEYHKGIMQNSYNKLVKESIEDAVRYSDYITFNSMQTQKEVFEKYGVIKNSVLIWHGTKRSFFEVPLAKRANSKPFIVGYIGALGQHKNVISILDVAEFLKRDNSIVFHIYGSGAEENNIVKGINENALHNVVMKGFLPEEKIIKVYDDLGIFLVPSLQEGLSHQILEAGARGTPIVVFKDAKIPKEVTKLCFKAKDEKDMANVISTLAKKGFSEQQRKKEIAYYSKFTWDRTVKEMYKLYDKLLNANGE